MQSFDGKLLRGHFRITGKLGGGGGGVTYTAVDTDRPGQPKCVVKQVISAKDPSLLPIARRLFFREAETLEKLGHHDQIPRLLAYFEEDDGFYLVQEFVEGHPLTIELPSGHHWSEAKVLQLLIDVLNILKFIHDLGVIHRDIKPANLVRRQKDGEIVLIDFGSVKQVSQSPRTTISIGTQGYMPSEQVRGKPRPNSDIYSLGMIGIQALTGIDPVHLEEDQNGELIWQPYAQVTDELAFILTKMVRYHFRDRYESATEAIQALQNYVNHASAVPIQQGEEENVTSERTKIDWTEREVLRNSTWNSHEAEYNEPFLELTETKYKEPEQLQNVHSKKVMLEQEDSQSLSSESLKLEAEKLELRKKALELKKLESQYEIELEKNKIELEEYKLECRRVKRDQSLMLFIKTIASLSLIGAGILFIYDGKENKDMGSFMIGTGVGGIGITAKNELIKSAEKEEGN